MSLLILCVILTRHRLTLPPETASPAVANSAARSSSDTMPRMILAALQDSPPVVLPSCEIRGTLNVQQQAQRRPSNRHGSRGQAQPDRLIVRSHEMQDCAYQRQQETARDHREVGVDAAFVAIHWRAVLTHARAIVNVARRSGWCTRPFPTNPLEFAFLLDAVMRRGKYRRLRALSQYHQPDCGLLRHSCPGDIK